MVDYAYYRDEYMGALIPQGAFDPLAKRAEQLLGQLCRDYVVSGGSEEKTMAVCAMAEVLYRYGGRNPVAATVGSVSVRYDGDISLRRRLYEAAAVYLDIYRGRWAV